MAERNNHSNYRHSSCSKTESEYKPDSSTNVLHQKMDCMMYRMDKLSHKMDKLIQSINKRYQMNGDVYAANSVQYNENYNKKHPDDISMLPEKERHSNVKSTGGDCDRSKKTSMSYADKPLPMSTPKMLAEVGVPCPQGWGRTQLCTPGGRFEWHVSSEISESKWPSLLTGKLALFSPPLLLPAVLNGWRTQIQLHRVDTSPCVNMSMWLRKDNYNQTLVNTLPLEMSADVRILHPLTGVEQCKSRRDHIVFRKIGMGKVLADIPAVKLDQNKASIIIFRFIPLAN